jgi:hypothetical protein
MSFFFDPEFFYQVITDYETRCAAQMDGIAFLRGRLKPDLMPMLQENVEHEQQVVKSCVAFAFRTMDVHLLSEILVAVLLSRRILITSDRIDVMERFCFALLAMVYPLAWPGLFIPVLPVTIIETIYAPFRYIIGLHSSMLSHTQSPEMDSYVLVDLDHGKVCHFNPPYKIPSQVQRQITKFGGLVQTVGIGKGFRDFIIRLVGYVVKRDPHDPVALAAAYNAMASAKGDKKDTFEVSILESQFVAQLMKEAEAGRGSEVYEAYWGESDVFVPPSRPPVPVPAPPLIGGSWGEISMRAQAFSTSSRATSIEQILAQRRAATVFQRQPPRIQDDPTDIKSKVAFFQGGSPAPTGPPAQTGPPGPVSQGEEAKDKKKGLFAGLFRGRANSKRDK